MKICEDSLALEDTRTTTACLLKVFAAHPEWKDIPRVYDGRSQVYTTAPFPLVDVTMSEDVYLTNPDGRPNERNKWRITMTLVKSISFAGSSAADFASMDSLHGKTALDVALTSFARWGVVETDPDYILNGSKLFLKSSKSIPTTSPSIFIQQGYYLGLKQCMSGLTFVCDMSTNLFLQGGEMIDLLIQASGCRNVAELVK